MALEGWRGGALDVNAAEGFGEVNAGNAATELLRHHGRMYPAPLLGALRRKPNKPRTRALDLEEAEGAIVADFGEHLPAGFKLTGLTVRGEEDGAKFLTFTYEVPANTPEGTEATRTAKGAIDYDADVLPNSVEAGDRAAALAKAAEDDPATILARALESAVGGGQGGAVSDADARKLREENTRLREQIEQQGKSFEERLAALEASGPAGESNADAKSAGTGEGDESTPDDDAEPWGGYDEANADVIVRRLREDGSRETAERVRAYEGAHKDRSGVIEAADHIAKPAGE